MDQEFRGPEQGKAARPRPGGCRLRPGACDLQSDPAAQASGGAGMSIRGRWRVEDTGLRYGRGRLHPVRSGRRRVRFRRLTGSIHVVCDDDAVEFDWQGNDEMEPANGDGWAELQDDGSLKGEICLHNGDDIPFIARRAKTSSRAC